jgi:hypothetical protein
MLAEHELQHVGLQRRRLRDRCNVRVQLQHRRRPLSRPRMRREGRLYLLVREWGRLYQRDM